MKKEMLFVLAYLLTCAIVVACSPAQSAGEKIAFTSKRGGNEEIYMMNSDGSGQTRLTTNPANDGWPAWSPDGKKIAFTSKRDGNAEVYVMNSDGSEQTRLTADPEIDSSPAWAP